MKVPRFSEIQSRRAFTLLEILVVMAIIAVLAALLLPGLTTVKKNQRIKVAQAELSEVETAIKAYKDVRGHFPPDNPGNPAINPLYFELKGTTLETVNGQKAFVTLDGGSRIASSDVAILFGPTVSGFMNFPGSRPGDEGIAPLPFLRNLRPNQVGRMVIGTQTDNALLVCSESWTDDPARQLVPIAGNPHAIEPGLNPWQYVASNPTHNPTTFDLWVDLAIGGKIYRVNNWSRTPEVH